ncbi:endonuclease/exonuclease/phosphatase family protein [Spirosoma fluviale]|uniref:Por secretion system C-terminal sorting domain-containing protein n=1 Tax=Spirosoma fluviale TaxID=1597977 RepID=A0A286FYV2_9BACT|nr:endonuclease/exonuclease/phosphatase family protein [Spirosoma fluviale]SOD88372.1 Por secretion system C-terminal sorting domain-containing protein [Spirosoma fluviale]
MNRILQVLLAASLWLITVAGFAQTTLVQWNFEGTPGSLTAAAASTITADNAAFGSGVTSVTFVAGSGGGRAYTGTGWNVTSPDANKYIQVSLGPVASYTMALSQLSFDEQRSGTGPTTWTLRSSLDNFATDINTTPTSTTSPTSNGSFTSRVVSLSANAAFQNLSAPVTFRIYGYGASGSGGTWRFDNITVNGTVGPLDPTAPLISVNPASLSNFAAVPGTPSSAKSYTVSAVNLTASLVLTAPTGYELSKDNGTSYAVSQTLTQSGGTVAATVINVRLTGAGSGTVNGAITNESVGATTQNVAVSGTVDVANGPTPIATARGQVGTSVTIQGRVTVSNQFGGKLFYIQDNTGGIAVYDPTTSYGNQVQLGDLVQVSGPVALFQGKKEINGVTAFLKVNETNQPVTPQVITIPQLTSGTFEGQLVTVQNATIGGSGGTFQGGAAGTYPLTTSDGAAELFVTSASDLVGATKPTGTLSVTGIADRYIPTDASKNVIQLNPRAIFDIPGSEVPPPPPTITTCPTTRDISDNDQTLSLVSWNLEWYGFDGGSYTCTNGSRTYADNGPTNEALQAQNVRSVMDAFNADIYVLQEVSDKNLLIANLPTGYALSCSDQYTSYFFQDLCDAGGNPQGFNPTSLNQKVCVMYKTSVVSMIPAESKPLLADKYNYTATPRSDAWASGRLPYLFVANVTVAGQTRKLHIVDIHAKSGSAQADYNRRKQDIIDLKAELDATYGSANLIIAGDYNDDVDQSIAAGNPSSYANFVSDATNYTVVSSELSTNGCNTDANFTDAIDHIMVSNELAAAYIAGSVASVRPAVVNYALTTSDHYPTFARFNLANAGAPLPVRLSSFGARAVGEQVALSWTTANETNSAYFEVERSIDAREFGAIGRVAAAGDAKTTKTYGLIDERPLSGTSYYRLKQVDLDGQTAYSTIVSVVMDNLTPAMELLGNPSENQAIRVAIRNLPNAVYRLTTFTGRELPVQSQAQADGSLLFTTAQTLSPGVYLLRADSGTTRIVRKVVVR